MTNFLNEISWLLLRKNLVTCMSPSASHSPPFYLSRYLAVVICHLHGYTSPFPETSTTLHNLPWSCWSRLDHWEVPVFTAWPGGEWLTLLTLAKFGKVFSRFPWSSMIPVQHGTLRSQEEKHSTIPTAAALGLLRIGICSWFGFWEPSHWFAEETMPELLGK